MERERRLSADHAKIENTLHGYTYYNKTFDDITDLFLFACSHGDYLLVYKLLNRREAQANVVDKMGKSALQLAIENEHFEVVKVLLNEIPYEQFRDALLLAIYMGHTKIADYILNHQTYRTFSGGFLDPTDPGAYDDSQFSSDITPIILASQYSRLQIVHQLLSQGERIKKPHSSMCSCTECVANSTADSLRHAQVRLSAYKGLASEVYIALTYPDPILQAFELGRELRTLAKVEHYFGEEYKKLAKQLSVFVARLLDNVRGEEELEIVLNKTGLPHEEKYENLARFSLAIQYREKPFVAHSNCQQKLVEKWYEDISFLKNANILKQITFYVGYMISFPFIAVIHYISPGAKISKLCQQPNLKFKLYITSYLMFLALLIASSYLSTNYLANTNNLSDYDITIYTNYVKLIYGNTQFRNDLIGITDADISNNITVDSVVNCDVSVRSMELNLFQIAVLIWVIGIAWNEVRQITGLGIYMYLSVPSNYVDCSMNVLLILHYIFLFASMICTRLSMSVFHSSDYWANIARYETMSDNQKQYYLSTTRHVLYWINADRFYWKGDDIYNIAEAIFSMANVVAICRLCFLLPISAYVGPLQVMLDHMIVDIAKWVNIILIFFVAFSTALHFLFSFFSLALDQNNSIRSLNADNSSILISIISRNSTTITLSNSSQCPDYFYKIINQTILFSSDTRSSNNNDSSIYASDFCQQSSEFDSLKLLGHYPAIYYFGQSFPSTIRTAFFTLLGNIANNGAPDRGYELITLSCYTPDPQTFLPGFDAFTSNVGFFIYGIFSFICVTVLINTLIAMLERIIKEIDSRADIEWKYARSKLYIEYIRDDNILPIPLNIFPSPVSIVRLMKRIRETLTSRSVSKNDNGKKVSAEKKSDHLAQMNIGFKNAKSTLTTTDTSDFNNEKIFQRKLSHVSKENLTYKTVIERIIKRFLVYYKNIRIDDKDAKDKFELKEIKHDLSALSFELFHELEDVAEVQHQLTETMTGFNKKLKDSIDIEQLKQHVNKRKHE